MNALSLQPNPGAPSGFPFLENHVRVRLGWNKDEMRAARNSRLDPAEFTRFKKRVFLSAAGAARLTTDLSAPPRAKKDAARLTANADDPQPILRVLRVCVAKVANPRLVLACPVAQDPDRPRDIWRVRIRAGTELRRRQKIMGRVIRPYTDYFDLVLGRDGRAAPGLEKPATPIPKT